MKEKFVHLVIRKTFVKDNNRDMAFAIDYSDVNSFSSSKKAEEFVTTMTTNKTLTNNGTNPFVETIIPTSEIYGDNTRAYKYYAQQTYNANGIRYGYMIIKQVIE